MDQGVAALWAGIAGLAGAGIGGAAAAWGAWISGKRAVEAAVQAAQRAATAEHQQWQRQARYDAYRTVIAITEEIDRWAPDPVSFATLTATSSRLSEAITGVDVLGPVEAVEAADELMRPLIGALLDFRSSHTEFNNNPPGDATIRWDSDRINDFVDAELGFGNVVRAVLGRPPT